MKPFAATCCLCVWAVVTLALCLMIYPFALVFWRGRKPRNA